MNTEIPSTTNVPRPIAIKLAKAAKIIKNPEKNGRIAQYNDYRYSNRDDISKVVRPALNKVDLLVTPTVEKIETQDRGRTTYYLLTIAINLIDGDTGEAWSITSYAESLDNSDKGIAKAVTQALRHWAINTFWLCDGGEEWMYSDEIESNKPKKSFSKPHEPLQKVPRRDDPPPAGGRLISQKNGLGPARKELSYNEIIEEISSKIKEKTNADDQVISDFTQKLYLYTKGNVTKNLLGILTKAHEMGPEALLAKVMSLEPPGDSEGPPSPIPQTHPEEVTCTTKS